MWEVGLSTALKIAVQIQGRQNVSNLGGEALIKESHLISLPFFSDETKFRRVNWPMSSDTPTNKLIT